MISTVHLIIFSLLLVNIMILVQSIPIKNSLWRKSFNSLGTSKTNDIKRKRNVFDNINNEYKLHLKIKETPAQIYDNVDRSVIFTDSKMNPNELRNLARKRRNIHLNNRRYKRDLSTYNLYNSDSPFYWYPSLYKRNIPSSFYKPQEWNDVYPYTIQNDDFKDYQIPFYIDDYDENDNDYEYNRYPILSDSLNIPYDNLQLQQKYHIDDLSSDNDDDEYFLSRYEPIENYFK